MQVNDPSKLINSEKFGTTLAMQAINMTSNVLKIMLLSRSKDYDVGILKNNEVYSQISTAGISYTGNEPRIPTT